MSYLRLMSLLSCFGISQGEVVSIVVVCYKVFPKCLLCELGCVAANFVDCLLVESGIEGDVGTKFFCNFLGIVVISRDDFNSVLKFTVATNTCASPNTKAA